MALNPLAGFKPLMTQHCITGSLRHIYLYNQFPVSEELLLGLGAGVGFIYWQQKDAPPFIGGRAGHGRGFERIAGERTGVVVTEQTTASARKAEESLLKLLDEGQPVMIMCDMGYLPYFDFGGSEYHFGGHSVVVCGYELATRQVLIADRDGLHPVSLDALAQARGSQHKPMPPGHKWFAFNFSAKRAPTAAEVRCAIAEQADGMLAPPISNLGVKGIRKTASLLPTWPTVMDEQALRVGLFNTYIFIDAMGGTGGGLFRYMFSRFLREAATITGEISLHERADDFQQIGDQWQVVAELLKHASAAAQPDSELQKISGLLVQLADLEEEAWSRLRAMG